ncbi:HepT-like ribonuclease domain-containing protein [Pyrinomonas methylaliphatogenes]|jgi:uncharacterized protein with HEPN domain|uniref:DUF86 domain-containing protein n=1 Tax=Pyrinomonas methylaliphatogenes TaxID=454194 RepID=A0A0B6X1K0_9BACT|nr:HepT-like ribonuclease domain-containing protein [Pyrinomonas methylaliphatogenes]CDM67176.1 hypothetical protein PYK22_03225 [Pyrinomonas methylaliphatogenes]
MPKDDLIYIGHMLDMAREARNLVEGRERADYDQDKALRYALAHLLQIIGEAARHVSPEMRARHAHIPWRAITGMRHKIVHDYMFVDEDIVWKTVTEELAPLVADLERIILEESNEET